MARQNLTLYLTARVSERAFERFNRKASKYGPPSTILRELIEAFADDRVVIVSGPNTKETLYVPRKVNQ